MGGKGSKSGGGQTIQAPSVQANFSSLTPNAAAMPGYGWMAGNMQQLMQTPTPFFPGQTYVGPSGLTQEGLEAQKGVMGQALGNYGFLSNAADVANNPYVQAQMKQNAQGAQDMLGRALAQQQGQSVGLNNLGSSRQGLMQGTLAAEAQKNLLAQNAQTQLAAYGQGLNAQQGALSSTGSMMGAVMQPGQTVEDYQARALQDQMARFNWMYQEPWQRMQNVQGVLGALSPLGVQQGGGMGIQTQQNPNYMSPMQGVIGGASLGSSIGKAFTNSKAPTKAGA
jgi:hypothetical protein